VPGGEPDDRGEAADRPQDPLVDRLRPDPSQPPDVTVTLEGVLGDSERPGFRRLYFTAELDSFAEFRAEDVLSVAEIPADQPPFLGEPATRVSLRRSAAVDFTRTQRGRPLDEFDLDVRLAPGARTGRERPQTFGEPGCLETFGFGCQEGGTLATFGFECQIFTDACTVDCPTIQRTCLTCVTACQDTCGPTCLTCVTCFTCGRTCGPTCGPTCETCGPRCGLPTRVTCHVACQETVGIACLPPTRICEAEP
jgi:hypothetical protein